MAGKTPEPTTQPQSNSTKGLKVAMKQTLADNDTLADDGKASEPQKLQSPKMQ